MIESSQNWNLFGYDLRLIGSQWRAAWREFLWGSASPVVARLDEPVLVHTGEGEQLYRAGKPLPAAADARASCRAILLPAESVLWKTLQFPLAAVTDLDAVMGIEIGANNPFPPGDAASGWAVMGATADKVCVGLAITSISSVMSYLARRFDCHDPGAYEVWARVGEDIVVLDGFGESLRRRRYRQRLLKVAGLLVLSALLIVAITGSFALLRYFELQRYEEMSARVQREAADASRARELMLIASDTFAAVNHYVAGYPNPHVELARLTELLGDDASLIEFRMTGRDIQLRGRARDAAAVVQQLTAEPAFLEVRSPQAITKLGDTAYEEFYLDITLAGGEVAP